MTQNAMLNPDDALVTKAPNRARKTVVKAKKFEPIPEFDPSGRRNKIPGGIRKKTSICYG